MSCRGEDRLIQDDLLLEWCLAFIPGKLISHMKFSLSKIIREESLPPSSYSKGRALALASVFELNINKVACH